MYKVIITTNDNSNKAITSVISQSQYNRIKALENLGGFRRFDLELYSDNEPKQKSGIVEVLTFLAQSVFYCSFAEIQSLT